MTVKEQFVAEINVIIAGAKKQSATWEEHQEWLVASQNLQGLLDREFPEEPVEVKEEE
jgi:hypothetical protein